MFVWLPLQGEKQLQLQKRIADAVLFSFSADLGSPLSALIEACGGLGSMPVAHPVKQRHDAIGQGHACDRGNRFVAGFDRGSLEIFRAGPTGTAGAS